MAALGGRAFWYLLIKKNGYWYTISGKAFSVEDLQQHCQDILDGRFAITARSDVAFFEARLSCPTIIPELPVKGLPDVRIICHNLVPVMAMLRVPTEESDGKANVHLGGIGFGINIASGKTTYAVQYNRHLSRLPGGAKPSGHVIPRFTDMLTIASKAQLHTNLGYLAADIVLDEKEGPVLVEINARAGLMVQIANRAGLKTRLEKVHDLSIDSPEKAVALSQQLFGTAPKAPVSPSGPAVIGSVEQVEVLLEEKEPVRVRAEMSTTLDGAVVDAELSARWNLPPSTTKKNMVLLRVKVAGRRLQVVAAVKNLSKKNYKLMLGGRVLAGFLIDPTPKGETSLPKELPKTTGITDPVRADKELADIDDKVRLLSHVLPRNMLSEKQTFLEKKGDYNPQFLYKKPRIATDTLRSRLARIQLSGSDATALLLMAKHEEIEKKLALIDAVGTDDFTAASTALYGTPSEAALIAAKERISKKTQLPARDHPVISSMQAAKVFRAAGREVGLSITVRSKDSMVATATAQKNGTVLIKTGAVFGRHHLASLIAHELYTHVLRGLNGKRQPLALLARGTADYLETEEGLAVWQQERVLPKNHQKCFTPAMSLIATTIAMKHSFADVARFYMENGFTLEESFIAAVKIKRGLTYTAAGGGFTRQHVYFSGYLTVNEFLHSGGDMADMYIGKTSLKSLSTVKKLKGLASPCHLPPRGEVITGLVAEVDG